MTDPIADMLTRIRNANQNRAASVVIPTSKVKEEIAKILKDEGFIEDYTIDGEGVQKNITLTLKYKNKERVITGLKRISKPGLRVYAGKDEIPTVLSSTLTLIPLTRSKVSSPLGPLTVTVLFSTFTLTFSGILKTLLPIRLIISPYQI